MTQEQLNKLVDIAGPIIFANEGGYGSINANDNGAMSIGKVQWHGNRAKNLLMTIYSMNIDQADKILGKLVYEIMGNDSWAKRIAAPDEVSPLSTILMTEEGKQAQDELAANDIMSYLLRGLALNLIDPSALIYFADGVNQYGTNAPIWIQSAEAARSGYKDSSPLQVLHAAILDRDARFHSRREKVYRQVLALNLEEVRYMSITYPANPPMPSRDIENLHPAVRRGAVEFLKRCAAQGLNAFITQTFRTVEYQQSLFAQGRTKPGNIVTNVDGSRPSAHMMRYAFDIARGDAGRLYDNSDGFFRKCGRIWNEMGGEWGGDWKSFVDMPHFQFGDNMTDAENRGRGGLPDGATMPWEHIGVLPTLTQGITGQSSFVRMLQGLLVKKGASIIPDGSFGPATLAALKAYTGSDIANEKTWEILLGIKQEPECEGPVPQPNWQEQAFKGLIDKGIINTPEYWEGRMSENITIGEVMGLLYNLTKSATV